MAADPAPFTLEPQLHLKALTEQRDAAADQAAVWRAIALSEQQKVQTLTTELMRMAAVMDAPVEGRHIATESTADAA